MVEIQSFLDSFFSFFFPKASACNGEGDEEGKEKKGRNFEPVEMRHERRCEKGEGIG